MKLVSIVQVDFDDRTGRVFIDGVSHWQSAPFHLEDSDGELVAFVDDEDA